MYERLEDPELLNYGGRYMLAKIVLILLVAIVILYIADIILITKLKNLREVENELLRNNFNKLCENHIVLTDNNKALWELYDLKVTKLNLEDDGK